MKYLMILPVFLFFSCKELTPKEKVSKNIQRKMAKIEGYKPVSFGELDSFFLSGWYLPEAQYLMELEERNENGVFDETNQLTEYGKRRIFDEDFISKRTAISKRLMALEDSTGIKFFGYRISHKYISGNDKVSDTAFVLDHNYNVVLRDTLVYR